MIRLPALAADLVAPSGGGDRCEWQSPSAHSRPRRRPRPFRSSSSSAAIRSSSVSSHSLNRPGGNVTGVNLFNVELGPNGLELLRELVPKRAAIGRARQPD